MTDNIARQPKGIPAGGQFAATAHTESTLLLDPAWRPVNLATGDSDTFPELADGEVIETLSVSRSQEEDGAGYWVSPSKTLNIKDLVADSDPRLHGEQLDAWLEKNSAVIEDFLAERYEADVTVEDDSWDEVQVECSAQLADGPLTEGEIIDAAWNGTKVVQLHNESDHGSFGSENLGRLLHERVEASTVIEDPYTVRAAAMRLSQDDLTAMVDARHTERPITDAAAVAISRQLGELRDAKGVLACPAVGRLARRGYVDTAAVNLELSQALTANQKAFYPDRQLARRIDSMQTWMRDGGDNG
jgi:hypothetical protein